MTVSRAMHARLAHCVIWGVCVLLLGCSPTPLVAPLGLPDEARTPSLTSAAPSPRALAATVSPPLMPSPSTPSRAPTCETRPASIATLIPTFTPFGPTLTLAPSDTPRPTATQTSTYSPPPTATTTSWPAQLTSRRNLVPLIAIDPGHGGIDIGAPHYDANGEIDLTEKEINLALALRLREKLLARGYHVVLTRDGDYMLNEEDEDVNGNGIVEYIDELQARVDLVNAAEADILLSIHQNAFYWEDGSPAPDIGGTVTFYCKDRHFSEASFRLAQLVQEHVVETFSSLGHTMMTRSVEDDLVLMTPGEPGSHLILLGPEGDRIARASEMPGALSETVFITHAQEARLIRDPVVQDRVATAYANAISAYLAETSNPQAIQAEHAPTIELTP